MALRQQQRFSLTPFLRQSLTILQMSSVELIQHIEAETSCNPVLKTVLPEHPITERSPYHAMATVAHTGTLVEHLVKQLSLMRTDEKIRQLAIYLAYTLIDDGYLEDGLDAISPNPLADRLPFNDALVLLQSCEPSGVGARDLTERLDLQMVSRGISDEARKTILENLAAFVD